MKVNLCATDRVVRGIAGVILLVVGLFVVRGRKGIVLDALGATLLFSGSVGFCHVYSVLRIDTSKGLAEGSSD